MNQDSVAPLCLFAGTSHPELASLISLRLSHPLASCKIKQEQRMESKVQILESVRMKDVYIVQTGTPDEVNNTIFELLIIAYACKTSCARRIIGVIPYLPYTKQSKMKKRGAIVSKLLAQMMCRAGFTHILTMDLHQKEIQGFFECPVDNLRASPFLIQHITAEVPDYKSAVIVAKNPESANRASAFADRLKIGFAVIHGEVKGSEVESRDGRTSPPPALSCDQVPARTSYLIPNPIPALTTKALPPMSVVGDVCNLVAIIIDDLIEDTGGIINAAQLLKREGASKVLVVATHGLFNDNAVAKLQEANRDDDIDLVVVTNTVPMCRAEKETTFIRRVDISNLLAEAIRRIHNGESMSFLFRNISSDD